MGRQIKSSDASARCENDQLIVDAPGGMVINGDVLEVGGTDPELNFATEAFVLDAVAASQEQEGPQSGPAEGCQLVWISGLIFRISAGTYYINGVRYTCAEQTVTLSAADGSNPRFDVIVLNTSNTLDKVTGTPAADPSEPSIDPSTQIKIALVLVAAGATTPAGVSNEVVYAENNGSDYTSSTSGSGIVANSTADPRTGTKNIEGTNMAANAYLQLERASSQALDSYGSLFLFIKSKATWANNRVLRLQWFLAGVSKGNAITIDDGYWGFNSNPAQIAGYQLIAIPIVQFGLAVGQLVNQLRITDIGGAIGFYIDDISLQTATTAINYNQITGLNQDTADARYLRQDTAQYTTDASPDDADIFYFYDGSEAVWNKLTWANIKTLIGTKRETIFIPASSMIAATTNGAASAQLETATNKQNYSVLDFDATTDESAHFQIAMPKGWDEGTITYQVWWSSTATDTDGVAWALEAGSYGDNEAIDAAFGTPIVVTDACQSAAGEVYITAESAALTIAGSPAAGDICFFRFFRDISDAADTATEDARLIGIKLFYNTNTITDA